VNGALLMTRENVRHRIAKVHEFVIDMKDRAAGIPEDRVDTFIDERFAKKARASFLYFLTGPTRHMDKKKGHHLVEGNDIPSRTLTDVTTWSR